MQIQQQKLGTRNTYTPTDTPQVCSSVIMSLNREETLSEHNLKTVSNNPDVAQQSGKTGHNHYVYVLNMHSQPVMPCSCGKARRLLKRERAKVVKRSPFTIQLLDTLGTSKQPITLGVDTGVKNVGFSCIIENKELFGGELELDDKMSKRLADRNMYRRTRRNKLWYRQPRFNNRVSTKKKGWLAPSVQHKIDSHIRIINKIKSLLPITNVIIESTQFDAQKLQNPDIKGIEYQQGQMLDFENTKMFVKHRDNYTCQICKKKNPKDDGIIDVHHIIQKKDGGSDRPDNLVTLHQKCHINFHLGKIKHIFSIPKSYKETSMMNSLWSRLVKILDCQQTFGYITKIKRKQLGLEKTHYNDAFVISGGIIQERCRPYQFKQKRKNNRCLQTNRKGYKPSIRRQRYNFQPADIIKINGKIQRIKGMFGYGRYIKLEEKYCKPSDVEFHFREKTIFGGLLEC